MPKYFAIILTIWSIFFMPSLHAEEAIFAMGCFWSAESTFRNHDTNQPLPGIQSLRVGYAGGTVPNPTYENHSGYKEALKIEFDPEKISYAKLLDIFWHNIDLFDATGQFCDNGPSYTTVVFYKNTQQQKDAVESKAAIEQQMKQSLPTEIISATSFYEAEEYHQNYSFKNSINYKLYRIGCGRDSRLNYIWGK
jgi:peptide-methionine (S)-S-oxide reductase